MLPHRLVWLLLALGIVLTLSVVPGAFTIDEPNYLVTVIGLRQGRLTVPGTEGLPPSRELLYFDPGGGSRRDVATPVASTAPPLYAPLALPFSYLGWRGLVLLNTVAFLVTVALVFTYARDHSRNSQAGWLAAATFVLGGYAIEYALGMWPHMLSVALTTAAVFLASRARSGSSAASALGAGFLAGLATGVRYQNFLVTVCLGVGLLIWRSPGAAASWRFGAGALVPLVVSALANHARLGSLNPISKGPGYVPTGAGVTSVGFLADALRMFWGRVVDHAAMPYLASTTSYMTVNPVTGAYMIGGAMKKAWLQSAPWVLPALVFLVVIWGHGVGLSASARREARALSVIVFATLVGFAISGIGRTDGLNYNQRYFLELVPLVAVAFAWSLDRFTVDRCRLATGLLLGGLPVVGALYWAPLEARLYVQTLLPLALAVLLTGAWIHASRQRETPSLTLLVGACLGWALFVHLADDVRESLTYRAQKLRVLRALDPVIPDRSAVFTYASPKDALGPLQLDRDVVILDTFFDHGADAPRLAQALLATGRRVFVLANGVPQPIVTAVAAVGRVSVPPVAPPILLLEIEAPP